MRPYYRQGSLFLAIRVIFNFPCYNVVKYRRLAWIAVFFTTNSGVEHAKQVMRLSAAILCVFANFASLFLCGLAFSLSSISKSLYENVFPSNELSRIWGHLTNVSLPHFMRRKTLEIYANNFGCNLTEMEDQELENYATIAQFFERRLKPGVRPIDKDASIVWPTDSRITAFGPVGPNATLEQIKGVDYKLSDFFGNISDSVFRQGSTRPGLKLYNAVFYLSPGDYHHFHSPVDWTIRSRRHIAGKLLSVSPSVVKSIPGVFSLNERVILTGTWRYGVFSMTAVGATNVGGIHVDFDPDLHTNRRFHSHAVDDRDFSPPVAVKKGDHIGGFSFGSTVVLVFEAPAIFEFAQKFNEHGNYGQRLGEL